MRESAGLAHSCHIADEHQRLRAYKRIAEAPTPEQAAQVRGELEDRYGPPPEAVSYLLEYAVLKSLAAKVGIENIDRRQGFVNVKFHGESRVDPQRLMELVSAHQGAQFTPAGVLRLPGGGAASPGDVLSGLKETLARLQG